MKVHPNFFLFCINLPYMFDLCDIQSCQPFDEFMNTLVVLICNRLPPLERESCMRFGKVYASEVSALLNCCLSFDA